jgi:uncharacterized protein YndB with AHSA1/START domain
MEDSRMTMDLRLEHSVTIDAPITSVWEAMTPRI